MPYKTSSASVLSHFGSAFSGQTAALTIDFHARFSFIKS